MPSVPRPSPVPPLERRWRVPPLPTHLNNAFTGMGILEEVSGPLALALWQSLRDVMLWAGSPPTDRGRLFASGAARARALPEEATGWDPQLRDPLATLVAMVEDGALATSEGVAVACLRIAQWAEGRGATATALAFAEAAGTAAPGYATAAYTAGRLARQRAEHSRAESWFVRAILMARQSGDWRTYGHSFIGLGRGHLQRGALPRARKHLTRAYRVGLRLADGDMVGHSASYLFIVAAQGGHVAEAERWAAESYRGHGPESPHLHVLAHDVASFWLMQGFFGRALTVFRALLPHFEGLHTRVFVLADVVRAAGGAGDRELFESAWGEVWERVEGPEYAEFAALSLLDLAHGATLLGDRSRAEAAARRALDIATSREEAKVRHDAEALLASLASAGSAPEASALAPEEGGSGDALAAELAEALGGHATV